MNPAPVPLPVVPLACPGARAPRWRLFRALRWCESELERLAAYPLAVLQVLLYLLIAWGVVGGGLGAGDLFWHEWWLEQFGVGFVTCWLFGTILFVTLLLLPPRNLPGRPEAARSSWRALFTRTSRCTWWLPTLYPSDNPGVRLVGFRVLVWLLVLLGLVYGGKVLGPGFRDGHTGTWFGVGYGSALVLGWAISLGAYVTGLRAAIVRSEWLRGSFRRANAAVPTDTAEVPAPRGGRYVTFCEVEAALRTGNPPGYMMRAAHNLRTLILLHAMAAFFALLIAVLLFLAVVPTFGGLRVVGPGVLLGLFLIFLNVAAGFVAFRWRYARVTTCAVVTFYLVLHTVFQPATMTFDNIGWKEGHGSGTAAYARTELRPLNEDDEGYVPYRDKAPARGLIATADLLKTFHEKHGKGKKPRLVLVATSGGGIRAAVWTGVVLDGLERELKKDTDGPSVAFRDHTRIITGASGGMVGATAFAVRDAKGDYALPEPGDARDARTGLDPVAQLLARDSLSPVLQTMIVRDFTVSSLVPVRNETDRGRTLEDAWNRNFTKPKRRDEAEAPAALFPKCPFARPMSELHASEAACERPSLVFAPIFVEDTKRLLVSNLDLSALTRPVAHRLDAPLSRWIGPAAAELSQPAVEFYRLFPHSDRFAVGTAARMSASFPVVSPAVPLPTSPPRRVVDAGYFDNYGIDVLTNWLLANREAVVAHTSGVLIVQIRAYPLEKGGFEFVRESSSPLDVFIGAVSAPLSAVFTARGSAAYHRNNQQLAEVDRVFNAGASERPFFATTVFELQQDAALSWYLTTAQKRQIAEGFYKWDGGWKVSDDAPESGGPSTVDKVRAIREWFRDK